MKWWRRNWAASRDERTRVSHSGGARPGRASALGTWSVGSAEGEPIAVFSDPTTWEAVPEPDESEGEPDER